MKPLMRLKLHAVYHPLRTAGWVGCVTALACLVWKALDDRAAREWARRRREVTDEEFKELMADLERRMGR